jgi:hypothetical protein
MVEKINKSQAEYGNEKVGHKNKKIIFLNIAI